MLLDKSSKGINKKYYVPRNEEVENKKKVPPSPFNATMQKSNLENVQKTKAFDAYLGLVKPTDYSVNSDLLDHFNITWQALVSHTLPNSY